MLNLLKFLEQRIGELACLDNEIIITKENMFAAFIVSTVVSLAVAIFCLCRVLAVATFVCRKGQQKSTDYRFRKL